MLSLPRLIAVNDNHSSDIKSAFDGAFQDIQALINHQISEAKKKNLTVKVSGQLLEWHPE